MRDACELRAHGIGEADVGHYAISEKCRDSPPGAVKELIRDDEIERRVFLLHGADCAEREDPLHTKHLHAVNVRAEIQLRWRKTVAPPVTGKKRNPSAFDLADKIGV